MHESNDYSYYYCYLPWCLGNRVYPRMHHCRMGLARLIRARCNKRCGQSSSRYYNQPHRNCSDWRWRDRERWRQREMETERERESKGEMEKYREMYVWKLHYTIKCCNCSDLSERERESEWVSEWVSKGESVRERVQERGWRKEKEREWERGRCM